MTVGRLVYLVGEPGVGKSTVMEEATMTYQRFCIANQPRRELLADADEMRSVSSIGNVRAVELGARLGPHPVGYPGTDALPMNTVVKVEEWLLSGQAADEAPVILGEGARLAVRRFLDAAIHAGWETHVVRLTSRRAALNRQARGSTQNPSWIQGARTRALRFSEYAAHHGTALHTVAADDVDEAAFITRSIAGLFGSYKTPTAAAL